MRQLELALEARRFELKSAFDAIVAADEPSVLKGGDSPESRRSRATFTSLSARNPAPDHHGRGEEPERDARLAHVDREIRRDSQPRRPRVRVPRKSPGASSSPRRADRRLAPRAPERHRIPQIGCRAEEIPVQSKIDEHRRHLRCADGQRPPLQEGRPLDRALDILGFEVKDQHIDGDLIRNLHRCSRLGAPPPSRRPIWGVRIALAAGEQLRARPCHSRFSACEV